MRRVFRSPGIYRLWGGVMVTSALVLGLLFTAFWLRQPPSSENPVIALILVIAACGLFTLIGCTMFMTWSGVVILTDQEIIWKRFNQQCTLRYQDILQVQYSPFLTLVASNGKIVINKQIEHYDELVSLLKERVPILHDVARGPFPLEITASWSDRLGYLALSVVLLTLAIVAGRVPVEGSDPIVATGFAIVLAGAAAGLVYGFLLKPPFRYTFTARQITTQSLLGKRTFDATLIQSIRMDKTITTRWGVDRAIYSIVIEFSDGHQLAIEQDATRYPLEQLLGVLQHHYGTTPDESAMRLTNSS